ncbi:MAG: hypothetical protein QOF66_1324 [Mycobacterium sp.]|nr:hypothetical protein [Mycobacterium sp.]
MDPMSAAIGPRSVDSITQLCAALAREEACEIMEEIKPRDLTACEMVALLTILRPARERKRLAQRQPAPVLQLISPTKGDRP